MSKKDDRIEGPFRVEITMFMKNDKGQVAKASYSMPVGRAVSMTDIKRAADETIKQVGDEFRLLNEQEFWDELVAEKYGRHIPTACPSDVAFDEAFKP